MENINLIKSQLNEVQSGDKEAILLVNYNNLGDLICDTPSLRNLRREYPDQEIVFLVRNPACVDLMTKCPYVDTVIEMPHSRDDYDKYYEFCKDLKSKYNFILSIQFVRPFKEFKRTYIPYMLGINRRLGLIQKDYKEEYLDAFTEYVELNNNTTRTEESLELLKLLNIEIDNHLTECWLEENNIMHFNHDNYIIVQTCATMESRMWHKENFIKLIKMILDSKKDLDILLTGTPKESDHINSIYNSINSDRVYVYTDLNMDTLLNYIKNARLVITNDTGPFHFARAYDVKRIVLFGISPRNYLIRGKEKNSIEFCGTNKCPDNCYIKSITNNSCIDIYKMFGDSYNCINTISPVDVFESTMLMLEDK